MNPIWGTEIDEHEPINDIVVHDVQALDVHMEHPIQVHEKEARN